MDASQNITLDSVNETPFEPPVTPFEPTVVVSDETPSQQETSAPQQTGIILTDVVIDNSNIAFNVIVSFLTVAQKRGSFSINESAKIWECLKFFLTPEQLAGIKQ